MKCFLLDDRFCDATNGPFARRELAKMEAEKARELSERWKAELEDGLRRIVPLGEKDRKLFESARELLTGFTMGVIDPLEAVARGENVNPDRAVGEIRKCVDKLSHMTSSGMDTASRLCGDALGMGGWSDGIENVTKTVVAVDLAEYMKEARGRESEDGAEGVLWLNEELQEDIRRALREAGVNADEAYLIQTGDGVLCLLDRPEDAVRFAVKLHRARKMRTRLRTDEFARQFRIGIDRGEVAIREAIWIGKQSFRAGGVVIGRTVRLEAKSKEGELLMSEECYRELPDQIDCGEVAVTKHSDFCAVETIEGKQYEKGFGILARRLPIMDLIKKSRSATRAPMPSEV